ncbi:MAG: large-conductance mechanosensitive channel protein MscL [Candidatus Protochlamydia sp.]|nr:large-conductance mechanosensitive channel protein MscL [Candidatus Protochlamydia sp.]
MSFFQEFKAFAMRGNVVDLAVGVIIGAAFGKIVSSFVNDIIMPPLGVLLGGKDFKKLAFKIQEAAGESPAVYIKYGNFINELVDFAIIALAIFLAIKAMNKLLPPKPEEPTTMDCPECLMPIPVKAKKCGHCETKF